MRKLQIKFPNQIRISGWDFGSSARAMNQAGEKDLLMTYESVSLTQAGLEKVSKSTTERKSMSTKTSIKRIALVAVSALGFGMVSTVSANAADAEYGDMTSLTVNAVEANYKLVQREDVAFSVSAGINVGATIDADETVTLKAVFTSKPTASTLVAVSSSAGDSDDSSAANAGATVSVDGDGTTPASLQADPSAGESLVDDTNIGTFDFTPDTPGTYVVRVWHDADSDGFYDAGTEVTRTITVIAGGTPAAMTVATYGAVSSVTNAGILDGYEDGSLLTVLLKDSAGNATKLAAGEGVTVSGTNSVTLNGTADSITLTSATTQNINGLMIVNVKKAAAGTSAITLSPAGTIASAFASQTSNLEFVAITESDAADYALDETSGVDSTTIGAGNALGAVNASTSKKSIAYELTSAAAGTSRYIGVNIVDTTGAITGYAGAAYMESVAISDTAAGTAAYSVTVATWSATLRSATGVAGADSYEIALADDTAANSEGWAITAATASVSAANSEWNVSNVSSSTGASVSVTLTVNDNFDTAMSG